MKKFLTYLEQNWVSLSWFFFLLSRAYLFTHPPEYVRYFEEYANIWYYGVPPYLQHWFEYPPITIPFISGPLYLDLWGIGKYRLNFRLMMLAADFLLFALVIQVLKKLKLSNLTKLIQIAFYLLVTFKAKDFLYDNLDSLFTVSLVLPAVAALVVPRAKTFVQWFMYWLGVGIKLVNAPLGLVYMFDSKKPLWQRVIVPGITFLMIWAVPLAIFRSSLSVIYVYHKDRTLQVESIPSLIVRGIDIFTKTEQIYFSQYKSFDIKGPISYTMFPLANIALAVSMLGLVYYIIKNREKAENPFFLIKVTLIFIFSYLVTNKVFSTPYHLWYPALLAMYPYKNMKERLSIFAAAAIFLAVATTRIPNWEIGPTFLPTLLPVTLQIPASIFLLFSVYNLTVPRYENGEVQELQPQKEKEAALELPAVKEKKKSTKKLVDSSKKAGKVKKSKKKKSKK